MISGNRLKSPSYPSNCLYFLKDADRSATEPKGEPADHRDPVHLDVIIVGAGLAGLATAIALARGNHKVAIYEQAQRLAEVGAGIQIPPNSSGLLLKLGLGPYLQNYVTEPGGVWMRRWEDGEVIGCTRLFPEFREHFGSPYWVIHRAHFHKAMHELAVDLGVSIELACKVTSYDNHHPSITLENGSTIQADLVIAADGVNSTSRKTVLGGNDSPPQRTGFSAYRAMIDIERIQNDPDVSWLLKKPSFNLWLGDNRHVMTYVIGAGNSFNIVLNHADLSDPADWIQDKASLLGNIRKEFEGWDPALLKIIGMIDKTMKWPLYSSPIMHRWVSGKLIVLGDAAHAMVPYMSQGAAIAVEDGVALARSLEKINSRDEVALALSVFEEVRILRATQMQEASLLNSKIWHFPDGPIQRARDEAMRPEVEDRRFSHSPNQWSDPTTQMWCYGYDTKAEIDRAWEKRHAS